MTTPNQLLNDLRDEIRKLNTELNDMATPDYKKLLLSNRLRVVGERLERLVQEMKAVMKNEL